MAKQEAKTNPQEPSRCPRPSCGVKSVYHRMDGTMRCYKCGYDSRRDAEEGESA